MKQLIIILISTLFFNEIKAQNVLSILNAPLDTVDCNQNCYTVKANFVKPKLTTQYSVSSIPFNPLSSATGTTVSVLDDQFSGAIPIGFDFCFYGNTYSSVYISANGHISFNANNANGSCSFDTKKPMPFYNSTFPDNAIFSPFTDGNLLYGGNIKYNTIGTAPFRKFVVTYTAIPYFSPTCTASPSTFQCILKEITNEIECHITNKSTCSTDTSDYLNFSTLGIQSIGANSFVTAPGKNASIWTATNEAWKFSPSGANGYSIQWFNGIQLLATDVDSISVCSPFPKTIKAKLTLSCPSSQYIDTIKIVQFKAVIDSYKIVKTTCKNTSNGSIQVFGSSLYPPVLYAINNGTFSSNNLFTGLPYGSVNIQVKDANGCITQMVVTIPVLSNLTAQIDSFKYPICPIHNGEIWGSANGGVSPYTYSWTSSNLTGVNTGNSIDSLGPGTYYFVVTDALGCKDSIGKVLVWDSLPKATSILSKPVCGNASGAIDLTITYGALPMSYSWSNGAITQDLTNLSAGTYTVVLTDANGCSKTNFFTLNDTLNMQINATIVKHTSCGLNNGNAIVSANYGLPPIQYMWSNGSNTSVVNNFSPGNHIVTVIDANGCTRYDTITINPSLAIQIQFLPANAHCDSANGLINTLITNTTGWKHYLWNTGSTNNYINLLSPGIFWLEVTDSIGCVKTDTITIADDGIPYLHVVQYTAPLCEGDTNGQLILNGISGVAPYKYSFDGVNFSATAQLSNFAAGTYTVYIRDANSCISDTVITFMDAQAVIISNTLPDTLICYQDTTSSFSVSASNGKPPYLWSLNNGAFNNITQFSNLMVGIYTIEVKDSNNCSATKNIEVIGPYLPLEVSLKATDIPCYEDLTGKLDAEIKGGWQPLTFQWSHVNSLFTNLNKQSAGIYKITVKDKKGCVVSATDTIQQDYCCNSYLPNSFTPNGDGLNDIFRAITPNKDISEFSLKVFNRWGQEVFSTKEIAKGWDGQIKGVDATMDNYFFLMYYKCSHSKEKIMLKGDVMLLR